MKHPSITARRSRRFLRNESGASMIEFAFLVPILMLLFYGIIEVSRFIQMHQKLDNAGHTLVDVLNQNLNLTLESINSLIATVPSMVAPYDTEPPGVIITSVQVPEGGTVPITLWQVVSGESPGSRVSDGKDAEAHLPQLPMVERDQVLTVEIYLRYEPLINVEAIRLMLGLDEQGVYKLNIARPRYGSFQFEPR